MADTSPKPRRPGRQLAHGFKAHAIRSLPDHGKTVPTVARDRPDGHGAPGMGPLRSRRSDPQTHEPKDRRAGRGAEVPERESRPADGARHPKIGCGLVREAPGVRVRLDRRGDCPRPRCRALSLLARVAPRVLRSTALPGIDVWPNGRPAARPRAGVVRRKSAVAWLSPHSCGLVRAGRTIRSEPRCALDAGRRGKGASPQAVQVHNDKRPRADRDSQCRNRSARPRRPQCWIGD